ncbi:hypothetical protein CIL05_06895 [Virgibacillus profundi]|uniref:Uncharacterized protein n=1 Tax=Virgibacillus profundi TaxID=2024555 RepID=A0A2A2IEN3_9BACI|nr:YonK family protein [Virgibacillus profundi]PAV30189.1 hypothetical protein CIL05_06895 [Virgibacillus profundi]PXY54361.1 hypothetical protein CIT14_06980 [Virgibacillus profundi]
MAKLNNNITFQKAAIEFQENGEILVHEVTKDGTETFSLTDHLREFATEDLSRLVNISIKEDVVLEGNVE